MEGVDDDFILFCADSYARAEYFRYMAAIPLFLDGAILRLNKEHIPLVKKVATDYLDKNTITNKSEFFLHQNINHTESTHNGIGLSYLLGLVVQNVVGREKLWDTLPEEFEGDDYVDLDTIYMTDEYKNSSFIFRWAVLISIEFTRIFAFFVLVARLLFRQDKVLNRNMKRLLCCLKIY